MFTPLNYIQDYAQEGALLRQSYLQEQAALVDSCARTVAMAFARGHKLLLCGNGGSAADCQHLAAEFVNRFMLERPPLPALALTTDSSILTSVGNDFSFEQIFAKQIFALGNAGDVLLAFSTSGNSANVLAAIRAAREKGLTVIGFTGKGGGAMLSLCDAIFAIPNPVTALVQELHITVGHLVCRLTDYYLFENFLALEPYLNNTKE